MSTELGFDLQILREWVWSIIIVVATFFAASAARGLLRRLSISRKWDHLLHLSPLISYLVALFGLQLAVNAAPLSGKAAAWMDNGLYIFTIFVLIALFRRASMIAIEWSSVRSTSSTTLQQGFIPLMRNIVTLVAFMVGGIMVLKHFNYDVMSLITALGVGSLAIGLASKDTLSNMISGFTIIIDNNLRHGDRINLAGTVGEVEEIGLRSTRLKLGDGNTLIVPNAELANTRILNLSMPDTVVSCTAVFRVPYTVPFSRVREIALAVIGELSKGNREKKAWVNLSSLSEGCQVVSAGFWLFTIDDQGSMLTEFNEKLLGRLDKEGIVLVGEPLRLAAPAKMS